MFNIFNLSKNPAETDVFKNSTISQYLNPSGILYYICGILGSLGLAFCYGYIISVSGSYTQLAVSLGLSLGLGFVAFELNQKRALPVLSYVITELAFVGFIISVFNGFTNFFPRSLEYNQPTSSLIIIGVSILALAFQKIQKSQVLFMESMIGLNIGIGLFIIYVAQNWREQITNFLGSFERNNLLVSAVFVLVALVQVFVFANYHFLMDKGYKAVSHIGSYISQIYFFTTSLIFINLMSVTIFGNNNYQTQSVPNQLVDIGLNLFFLPILMLGIYLSKHLKNDISKAISVLFGFVWLMVMLTKVATLVNFDQLFPIYIGATFIAIGGLVGYFASKLKPKEIK